VTAQLTAANMLTTHRRRARA